MEGLDDLNDYLSISSVDSNRHLLVKYLERLLKYPDFNPAIDNNKAIIIASEFGREDLVKILLADSRVDPAANNNDAIVRAATDGHFKIVELLMKDSRVNPSDRKNQALRGAIADHNAKEPWKSIVKLLLTDHRVDWRLFKTSKMVTTIFNEQKSELLYWIEMVDMDLNELAKIVYQDICNNEGIIPPLKLVVLMDILGIKYYPKDTTKSLCAKISDKLFLNK